MPTATAARTTRRRDLPKILTPDEVEALFKIPNRAAPTGLRNLCMLTLMHRAGLRVGEVCGLHLRDLRLEHGQVHLRPDVAKGHREALAYLDPHTIELLRSWLPVRRRYAARAPELFTTLRGGPVSTKYCRDMIGRYARRAGIERGVNPHQLRHTYASELLREGYNIREVQELMRHADIRSTGIYLHVFEADLARKVRERGIRGEG